jgi:hypothetical protein
VAPLGVGQRPRSPHAERLPQYRATVRSRRAEGQFRNEADARKILDRRIETGGHG